LAEESTIDHPVYTQLRQYSAELPKADVTKKLQVVKHDLQAMRGQLKAEAGGNVAHGGVVVLVPTDKPIHEWDPIATRELSHVEWIWKEDVFAE